MSVSAVGIPEKEGGRVTSSASRWLPAERKLDFSHLVLGWISSGPAFSEACFIQLYLSRGLSGVKGFVIKYG